jgi:hypothetical protein
MEWDSVMEGWTRRFIFRYVKFVYPLYDVDDLMQEAALVFMACRKKYRRAIKEQRRFMVIYRESVWRRFWILRRSVRRQRAKAASHFLENVAQRDPSRCLNVLGLPDRLGVLLARLGHLEEWRGRSYIRARRWARETQEDFFRRIVGAGPQEDVAGQLRTWLTEEGAVC